MDLDVVLRLIDQLSPVMEKARDNIKKAMGDTATAALPASAAIERLVTSMSGNRLISDAHNIVAAIERIGGVTKLTAAEKERYGAVIDKAAEKIRALGGEEAKAADALEQYASQMKRTEDATQKTATSTEGLGARITGLVAAGAAAKAALGGLIAIGVDWVTSAGEAENASVRVDTALRAQGTYTPQLTKQYADLASQFQNTTVFGDELIQEMEALLVTVGGVMPKNMKAALTASTDLAAGLRIDLSSATLMVSKALEGNIASLKKAGIVVDETAFKTEGATAVFDAIAAHMRDGATAQAATFAGQMARLGNVVDDVKETLGSLIARGLQPAIDLFMKLPEPVRTGAVVVGLLGTAVVALSIAVAGIGAAVALALPLLGMSTATAGAAAVVGLTAVLGPLAIAIAGVTIAFAAWKAASAESGWVREVSDGYEYAALRLKGYTAAQADAMIATDHATQRSREAAEAISDAADQIARAVAHTTSYTAQLDAARAAVAALTPDVREQILAAQELGVKTDVLTKEFGLNETALKMVAKAHSDAEAAAKKHKDELDKLKDKIGAIERGVVGMGDSWEKIGTRIDQSVFERLGQMWDEYDALRVQHGGTATDIQIAQIDRWAADLTAKMIKAKGDTADFYAALGAVSAEKLNQIGVDWAALTDAATNHSKAGLQQIADKAQATFRIALTHVGDWEAGTIEKFQLTAEAAQRAADNWDVSFNGALDSVDAHLAKTVALTGSIASVNPATGAGMESASPLLRSYLSQGYTQNEAMALAGGYGASIGAAHGQWDESGWHEGRASGGPVSAGGSYLVGEIGPELLRMGSRSGSVTPITGGTTIVHHIYVTQPLGTPSAIARAVDEALMARQRHAGQRMPLGS
jgi:hypothetical protein